MKRKPLVAQLPTTFHAEKDHIVAIFHVDGKSTLGIRFYSPEQMMTFFSEMMEEAVKVWPNNEWIRMYLEE